MDHSPPGSSVHEIPQARILEWVAMTSSSGSSWTRDQTHISFISCIGRFFTTSTTCEASYERFVVQSLSCVCLTLCDPTDCSMLGFPVLYHLPEFVQTHVHWVSYTIQSSHPLSPPFSSSLQSFPASGTFPMSWLFASGGQSIGASASASVLPMNIQDWFPLGLTDLISLLSKGISRLFFRTTTQKHQFFGTQLSSWSNSHIHTWLLEKP